MYLAISDGVYGVVPHPKRIQMLVHERGEWRCRWRVGFALPGDARHHRPPLAACTTRFSLAARVVIFSRFRPRSPFRRVSAGDSSPAPPPDTPRTWGRLGPDFSPSAPDFFSS